jgi:hypothetical protein
MDLFAQVLPFTFKDDQVWAFEVPEVKEPSDAELIQRARDLKEQAQQGGSTLQNK